MEEVVSGCVGAAGELAVEAGEQAGEVDCDHVRACHGSDSDSDKGTVSDRESDSDSDRGLVPLK